jgi:antirestriction protein ArdC/phage/plasmid primase-like uncharacterized protein
MAETKDYRQILTDKLIEQLEAGTAPWQKPWDAREGGARLPYNPTTDKPYRGANSLYLTAVAMEKGYADPRWATYKQAAAEGWQVRKGEKGSLVEYWKFSEQQPELDAKGKPVMGEDGKPKMVEVMLEKPQVFRAVVFNAQQMDNVPELAKAPRMYEWDPNERAEAILQGSGARIYHDQADRAFYSPSRDEIHLPARDQFKDQTAYYSTALHELGHWTGHESRLGREFGGSFGSVEYAKEELRAELSSYFMADKLGVPHDPGQHAAYVKSWVKVLQEDKNEIFRAARDAEKITDYVLTLDRTRERERGQENTLDAGGRELGERGAARQVEGLRPHDIPPQGTPAYAELLRASIAERNANGDYHQLNAEAQRQLGEGVKFGMWAGSEPLKGQVIAETKHSFAVKVDDQQAVALHKLEFRELPAVGQTVEIGERQEGVRSIKLVEPERDLATAKTPLQVPFKEKEAAKALGAKWDKEAKGWYAPEGTDLKPLAKWLPAKEGLDAQRPGPDVAAESARFRVDVVKPDGAVVSREHHADPEKAMRAFVAATKQDFGKQHGPGSYAALVDEQGKLDAGWTAERGGTYRFQFAKEDGRAMYEAVEKAMRQEPQRAAPALDAPPASGERTWLAVPYPEKDKARDAGAKWDKQAKAWYAPPGADLDKLDRWVPKQEVAQAAERKQGMDPKAEFAAAIKAAGLVIEGEPIMDGKLHRVPVVDGKKGMRDGAYVGYMDGKPSGHIQNFRTGHKENWTAAGVQLSAEEQAQLAAQAQLAKQQRAAELAEQHGKAAEKAQAKWDRLPDTPASGENAYLARKGVGAHGVKFDGERLVVPVRDVDGKLWSVQSISPEEGAPKMFEKGGRKTGNMHVIGELKPGAEVLVAEGYATGASLHQATGKTVAVAFDSGNLDAVVGAIKQRHPTSPIYIMGDNDKHAQQNVGVEKAMAAAQKHQVGVAFPEFREAGKLTDFNDLHKAEGLEAVKAQVDKALAQSMEQSRQQAAGIAKAQLGDGVDVKAPGQNTRHTGEVLGVTGYHATQATGRSAAVVHAVADLDQRPEPGKVATIQYRDGRGKVQDRAVEQQKQQQLQR